MKRIVSLLLLALLLVTAGCAPHTGGRAAAVMLTAAAAGQATATPAGTPPAGADLMPRYPHATRSADTPEERQELAQRHPSLLKNPQQRAYTTGDTPAVVINYYESEMARRGWQLLVTQAGDAGGMIMWELGRTVASLQVAQNEGETVIFLEWGEAGPAVPI